MNKMVDVVELVNALIDAGMRAGIAFEGSSSYPLVTLAGGLEIWGYVPDSEAGEKLGFALTVDPADVVNNQEVK